ncbi:MAG: F0F1 ATP synthase subunit alpha, partial [Candidatus Krumholzibacteria bacterium]|nr:F0F1 ATP synthase subunit alpha [Candidatus Krumholzibacteria bacterium]
LADFARFGSDLDKSTVAQLTRGEKMVEILKQDERIPMPIEKQVMIIFVANKGYLDDIPTEYLQRFESEFHEFMAEKYPDVVRELASELTIAEQTEADLSRAAAEFKKRFMEAVTTQA